MNVQALTFIIRLDERFLDLIDRMLVLDPTKRISASEALDHSYFRHSPLPLLPKEIPSYISCHEMDTAKKKVNPSDNAITHNHSSVLFCQKRNNPSTRDIYSYKRFSNDDSRHKL